MAKRKRGKRTPASKRKSKARKQKKLKRAFRQNAADANRDSSADHPEQFGDGDQDLFSYIMQMSDAEIRPIALLERHPTTKKVLCESPALEAAAIFGAMLLDPRLQSNCIRLEALVHMAFVAGAGTTLPSAQELADCFNEVGTGMCGTMEDPAEDVFVSRVMTSEGNFRVCEGTWESGCFYLQRALELVASLPAEHPFLMLRRKVSALLRLSEAVCDRAQNPAFLVGNISPQSTLKPSDCAIDSNLVRFSHDDLSALGIHRDDLDVFILDKQFLPHVLNEPVARSPLQRFPIADSSDGIVLLLPTAVSYALRAAIVEFLFAHNLGNSLRTVLARQYAAFFHQQNLLGSFLKIPLQFVGNEELPIAEATAEFDRGRFFHFLLFTDTFEQYFETGVGGINPTPGRLANLLEERIRAANEHFKQDPHYRGGRTLLVHCGIGRGFCIPELNTNDESWSVECLTAPDLFALSRMKKFNALKLWKLLEEVGRLAELGMLLHNPNGLLNLVSWMESNDGHLVSHADVPKGFRGSHGILQIAPHFVLELRSKIAIEDDARGVPMPDGTLQVVRRLSDSYFLEDNRFPIYSTELYSPDNGIPFVYLSERRAWWCHVVPAHDNRDFDRWQMLRTWLPRVASAIEPSIGATLPDVVVLQVIFQCAASVELGRSVPSRTEIEQSIRVSVNSDAATVVVQTGEQFDLGQFCPTNVSERSLVASICRGFFDLAKSSLTDDLKSELECQIVTSDSARQLHVFQSNDYRTFPHSDLDHKLIRVDNQDSANTRLGLAFRAEARKGGRSNLKTKRTCTSLLNAIVRTLEDELCKELQSLDRLSVVEMAVRNHERAVIDRVRWHRTAAANLALHDDKKAATAAIVDYDLNQNAVIFPSRVLIEFAICECPETSGKAPGAFEFAKLMAKVNAISHLSGWSNAIHLDAMPPEITITPLGDVQAVTDFQSRVLMPFAEKGSNSRIMQAVDDYPSNYEPADVSPPGESKLDLEFENAWEDEFGFGLDELRLFMDSIEDVGLTRGQVAYRATKSELFSQFHATLPHAPDAKCVGLRSSMRLARCVADSTSAPV